MVVGKAWSAGRRVSATLKSKRVRDKADRGRISPAPARELHGLVILTMPCSPRSYGQARSEEKEIWLWKLISGMAKGHLTIKEQGFDG